MKKKLEPIEDLLRWCGKKYRSEWINQYPLILFKRKIGVGRLGRSAINSTDVILPIDLQNRIIDVIEQYVDEKHKELEEI